MGTVGAYDAKAHLSELLKRTSQGEQITITRHGVPVAILVPATKKGSSDVTRTIREIRAFRKGRKLGGTRLKAMIEEGRRF